MKIAFQKKKAKPSDLPGIDLFWRMSIDGPTGQAVIDHFIPELKFDYFYLLQGTIKSKFGSHDQPQLLPSQFLKTIQTKSLSFHFTLPLIMMGVRLNLSFADFYDCGPIDGGRFKPVSWLEKQVEGEISLEEFSKRVQSALKMLAIPSPPQPRLTPELKPTSKLADYSPRHRRRLIKAIYGVSHKEMQVIQKINVFLQQACDFSDDAPHIIDYLGDDAFYDQSHLNHLFKKTTGFSLLKYFEHSSALQDNLMAVSYNE
ncbi:MAG: hypothetical protein AAF633_01825 [Chloroflexota bacterium]